MDSSPHPLLHPRRDEDAPAKIADEDAVKPEGWLDDEAEYIGDPDAVKPEDWYVISNHIHLDPLSTPQPAQLEQELGWRQRPHYSSYDDTHVIYVCIFMNLYSGPTPKSRKRH